MKRSKIVLCMTAILLCGGIKAVSAGQIPTGEKLFYDYGEETVPSERGGYGNISLLGAADADFDEYFFEHSLAHEEVIDVSMFNIYKDDIADKYYRVAMNNPELLLRTMVGYTYSNDIVMTVSPGYLNETYEEDVAMREAMQAAVREYVSYAEQFPGTLDRIRAVHDKIVAECKYDTDYNIQSHHAVGIFLNKTAVCQGYAQAFYTVMRELGINTGYCMTDFDDGTSHMWNYIELDGEWYHTDLTWDDPLWLDESGEQIEHTSVDHEYFLRSDTGMDPKHNSAAEWYTYFPEVISCTDKKYETDYFFNMPGLTDIGYENGEYIMPLTVSGIEYRFTSKTLHSGALLVSDPQRTSVGNRLCFYCMREPEELWAIIKVSGANGRFERIVDTQFPVNAGAYQIMNYADDASAKGTRELLLIDRTTMMPYAKKTVFLKEDK